MKYPICIFLCSIFFSCGDSISFRIHNKLDDTIPRCNIGSRIFKSGNSYSTRSYGCKWKKIKPEQLTSYKRVKGSFLGYANCSLEFFSQDRRPSYLSNRTKIKEAIDLLGLELMPDSIQHPYEDKMITGERLPAGKYTIIIEGFDFEVSKKINFRITKDD